MRDPVRMDYHMQLHTEALIFAAEEPITIREMADCLEEVAGTKVSEGELEGVLDAVAAKYAEEGYAFELVNIAGGYQFLTKGAYQQTVGIHLKLSTKRRLSRSALETLAIIAYKQPVPKAELEKIRGVNCDYAVQKLLEKELIEIRGREEAPGRPLIYGTTTKFMDYFGLGSLSELPTPRDFRQPDSEVGKPEGEENERAARPLAE